MTMPAHSRLHVVHIEEGRSFHRNAPQPLQVVLFNDPAKLRSHALKHCANLAEAEAARGGIDAARVAVAVDALKDLGCPFFVGGFSTPPCRVAGKPCGFYDRCQEVLQDLEEDYLALCRTALDEGAAIPRNAAFCDGKGDHFYWAVTDRALLAKLVWKNDAYLLMTCFVPGLCLTGSLPEKLDQVKRMMQKDCSGAPLLALPETWQGARPATREAADGGDARPARRKPKRQSAPVKSGGRQKMDWRRELMRLDDADF